MSQEMSSDVKLRMKSSVVVEKLNSQWFKGQSSTLKLSREKSVTNKTLLTNEHLPQVLMPTMTAEMDNGSPENAFGSRLSKITRQHSSMFHSSSPSHPTCKNHIKEVAVQGRSNRCMEKSPASAARRKEKQRIHPPVVSGATLGKNNHQVKKICGMQFQESQQRNEAFSAIESSPCSSPDSSECFILEDEKGCSPIVEIGNSKEPHTCSDKPITDQQNFYKEVMYELMMLRKELETERGMRQMLESKVKELEVKTPSRNDTLKSPPIRLEIEAVPKGNYISALDDSNARSPNYSDDAAEDIEPDSCDEPLFEDADLTTDGFHLHKSTLNCLANTNEIQTPVKDYERMQISGRQSSKEKNFTLKHNLPAFNDSKKKATDNSSRKRKVSQERCQTNYGDSLKKLKNSSEISVFSSSSLITSREGLNAGILDTRIKLQQQTNSTSCTKEVQIVGKRTGSVLKGSEFISVNEDLSLEGTLVNIARKRPLNELFSEITQETRVKSKTNAYIDQPMQPCYDNGNNRVTRNDTTGSNEARNHEKQWQISEGKTDSKLTKVVKKDGIMAGRNKHLRNQSDFGLVDGNCIPSESCSRNQGFTEIRSCSKTNKLKTNGDLISQSSSDLVDENHSLREPRSRDRDTLLQGSEMKTSNNLKQKFSEMNKCISKSPTINCTKEVGVLSTTGSRTRSITPECKTKNPCKSSLDYIYGCNLCGLKFCGMESLRCHMPCVVSVTNKDPLKCGACSKTFRDNVDLERHFQGLSSKKHFECEICCKNCASESCLAFHMQTHDDIGPEKCVNQSNTLLSNKSQASQKSSECTICNKQFFSKLCLQSHMKQHKGKEAELLSIVSVDCPQESLVIMEKSSDSQEPQENRSFQDAAADLVSKQAELQGQNSRRHCDRERSSWSIFDQDRLFCVSRSSVSIDLDENNTSHQQNSTSLSIFDRMSSKIPSGQKESTELICAQKIKKTYRPYCVKCWNTFKDLQALEEHAKFCNESCQESSPRETITIQMNDCVVTKSEDRPESSECVLANGSEEIAVQSFEAVADNGSVDVANSNAFEELGISSCISATSKLYHSVDEVDKDGLDEVANGESHDWAKNNLDGLPSREPNDVESMVHDLAKNAADDLFDSESYDLGGSFSDELANIESYLANSESHLADINGSGKVANGKSDDLAENLSDDLSKNGSDDSLRCLDCRKIFSSHEKLDKHMELHKLFGSSLHCSRCKQKFTVLDSIQEHTCQAYSIMGPEFRCPECEEGFEISQQLKKHISEVHSMDQHLKCKLCGKQHKDFSHWNRHVQAHRTDRHYVCNKCGKRYKHLQHLKRHLPCLSDSIELKCPKCNEEFLATELSNHLTLCQNEQAVKCLVCQRFFHNQSRLDNHMPCLKGEKPYQCSQCDKCFGFHEDLISHVQRHSVKISYVCVVCNKAFADKAFLLSHFKIHKTNTESYLANRESHVLDLNSLGNVKSGNLAENLSNDLDKNGSDKLVEDRSRRMTKSVSGTVTKDQPSKLISGALHELPKSGLIDSIKIKSHACLAYSIVGPEFRCPECEEGFEISQQLKKHISEVHSMDQHLKCKLCDKHYEDFSHWNSHVQAHRTDRPYVCNKCGNRYKRLQHLKKHLPCLSDSIQLKCPKCNEEFLNTAQLRNHMTLCQNERAVKCPLCQRLFQNQSKLDKHMPCLEGEKPYQCSQCDKCFSIREDLFSHVQRHSVQKSYVCGVCDKAFTVKTTLVSHLKIHTINAESYLANRESHLLYMNSSSKVANGKSLNLDEILSDDLGRNGSDNLVEDCSGQMTKSVSGKFKKNQPIKLSSSGSHKSGLIDSVKIKSHGRTKHSSHLVNFTKAGPQKLTKNVLHEASNCSSDDPLRCPECRKIFSGHQKLNQHMELHKLFGSTLHCSRCKQKFTVLDSILGHTCQAYYIMGPEFRCPECEEDFKISQQLKKHISEVHSMEQPLKCKLCGKQYKDFSRWNHHVQAHRTDRPYVCNKCGKRYRRLHHLKRHLPCLSNSTQLKCPKCNEEFVKVTQLGNHITLCQNEQAVKCPLCQRLFHSQSKLDRHMPCLKGEKPYQCSQCDRCFSSPLKLTNHLLRHSDVKPYVCDVCGKGFATETFLQNHSKNHTTDRRYKCNECDRSFNYECLLRNHESKIHKGIKKRFACGICSKTFCSKMYLKEHMCSHTGENPHLCSICGKGFPAKILLKYHLRVHTGEKPFSCKYCYRRFSMPRSMRNHERVHTGETPYECTICGMKFPQSSYLKNHSKKAHTAGK